MKIYERITLTGEGTSDWEYSSSVMVVYKSLNCNIKDKRQKH